VTPPECDANRPCPNGEVCRSGQCEKRADDDNKFSIEGGGFGCRAAGGDVSGGSAGLLAMFGLVLGWVRRRRVQ
jgi:MYXO-CTERM domain-containing protein